MNEGRLVEIQRSGLSSIRDKINRLLSKGFVVEVVKPLVARKRIIKLDKKNGREVHRRWSPKRGSDLSVFDELIYFTRVFPHPNLKLIVPLVEIEETRYPGHGKRRRWRKADFVVQDRELVKMMSMQVYERATDLHRLLPSRLVTPFDTKQLAEGLGVHRSDAQRIAYVLKKTGSVEAVGKRGNAILYELAKRKKAKSVKRILFHPEPTEADEPVTTKSKPGKKPAKKKARTSQPGTRSAKRKKTVVRKGASKPTLKRKKKTATPGKPKRRKAKSKRVTKAA